MVIKFIITDMDGTIVDYPNEPFRSSWDAIGDSLNEQERREWYRIRDYYYPQRGRYLEWITKQLEIIKGIPKEKLISALRPIPYVSDAKEFFNSLNGDYITGMITSGFPLAAELIHKELSLDFCLHNQVNFEDFSVIKCIDLHEKDQVLDRFLEENYPRLSLENNVCYIGDNSNDIPVLKRAALPLCINPKNGITNYAKEIKTFSEILNYTKTN